MSTSQLFFLGRKSGGFRNIYPFTKDEAGNQNGKGKEKGEIKNMGFGPLLRIRLDPPPYHTSLASAASTSSSSVPLSPAGAVAKRAPP